MAEYIVITVPGIGEQASPDHQPSGMLKLLTDKLPRARQADGTVKYSVTQFDWQNTYGPVPVWDGASYERNRTAAVTQLADVVKHLLDTTHYAVVLAGYSGGAHVVSEALARLAREGRTSKDLPAVVAVSNPVRHRNDGDPALRGRWGIAGEHANWPNGIRVFDLANPVDVICQCPPPPHPLRAFSDLTAHFSLADPVGWGVQLLEAAKRGQFQNAWRLSSLPAWWDAVALARGYLFDGQHTSWYVPQLGGLASRLNASLP